VTCLFCGVTTSAWDHSACAFIAELAGARGVSFAEAERQYNEDNLIDATEARMRGEALLDPAPEMAMFSTAEEKAFLVEPEGEIAPSLLDRLGLKHWLRR
jgi:hypothetical protein